MSNSQRLVKNTMFLYLRMILIMLIQLYTVRVVLKSLGETDYGVYMLVSGIVSMFSFMSSTLAISSQRYFSIEIARNNSSELQKVFSLTLIIYSLIALVVLLLSESLGVWFLNNYINIPEDRVYATNWVYQFSILSFILTIFKVPYDAMIIAKEKMNIFAYLSILEVVLKLFIVYFLYILEFDKLILYGFLSFIVVFIVTAFYKIYCNRVFSESKFVFYWNNTRFNTMLSFSGWNLFGSIAGVLYNQGVNVLLNIFFGPIVNTARGIAFQVNSVMNQLTLNFMTAVRPQITKLYATDELVKMFNLVFKSTKYSFFLILIISTPLIWYTNYIYELWLGSVPMYVDVFTKLILGVSLIDSLSYSIMSTVQATGRVKVYQIVVGLCFMLNLPLSFLFLKNGYPAEFTFYIAIVIAFVCFLLRLIILNTLLKYDLFLFMKKVMMPVLLVVLTSSFLNYFLYSHLLNIDVMIKIILSIVLTGTTILLIGLSTYERLYFYKLFLKKNNNE